MVTSFIVAAIVCLVVVLVLFTSRILLKYLKDLYVLKSVPTADGALFLVGHTFTLKTDPTEFYQQILQYCKDFISKPVFKFWIGPRAMIVCNHPSTVEAVLGSSEVITKSLLYRVLHKWIGFGLLTSTGKKWQARRKLLTPSFHFSILQNYYSIMNEHARQLVDVVQENISSMSSDKETPVLDIFPFIVSSALDVICEAAMGYNLNSLRNSEQKYANAIKRMTDIVMQRMKFPYLFVDFIFYRTALGREQNRLLQIIHNFTSGVIKERREEMKEAGILDEANLGEMSSNKKKWRLAFLDLLLHEQYLNGTLSDSDIQEEVDTFMFEGHDTTAVAMTWCLYNVGLNRRVQDKVHEELDEVFPNRTCDVTNERIGRLQYLDKVIKESLRLFPSVPFYGREVTEDFQLDKYQITKGCTLIIIPPALHRNPNFFTNPEEFYPERFDERSHHPYAYVPFSAGPRNCIGAKFAQLEMKILLSTFLRMYEIKSQQNVDECNPAGDIILKPSKGIYLDIRNRD